ncbi:MULTISPECIES: phosphate/phosphite/phosphonate ABC transporter substrate-binding protein [Gordonia]|uniref:Phosphonate ABC transporter substrate-binding protein n=1 Tax=Gordonia alkanivorans CGMCC 6845 TaxID=1423140 RepID=W9DDZ2_9ACTN|nr:MULTISPECIES: phosphate/phosphite/phosphonate ABC transporter substrate-binding protein [Gordonia]ETA06609.1 phosphonate ABC transporter substrate-binding protein [Gordonia alkanivorans CGMCC 6845]MDH3008071.1 phosphate/phosphite/phosphonate ABC transporter substrate-binding protein [Gordonia alkanivorans]MDH3011708.1 phosphate/phosphite/phosphonate ABC transporter substrate-binding protein [Gordonia alkanivorans]MDH3016870.1 phosphate/phosphite/phosphonate ABC transporter substrate-binding 
MRAPSIKTLLSVAVAGALSAAALSGCSSAGAESSGWAKSPETLVFAAVPDKAGSDANWKPLQEYLAKTTGYEVEYYPTSDYTALIAALTAGKADIGTMGGLQYVMATAKGAEIEPVAASLTSPDAEDAGYFSEAIVPADSTITSLSEARGKSVCFIDPNSTSGFLFGLKALSAAGLDVTSTGVDASGRPKFDDFTPIFAGSHDKSAQAVASKQCDLGFAEDTVAAEAVEKGQVKVINREYVPGGPFTVSSALPAEAKTKVTDALRGASVENIKKSGVPLTDGFTSSYFGVLAVDPSYFAPISDLCQNIAAANCAS